MRPHALIDRTFCPSPGRREEKRGKGGETSSACCIWTIDLDAFTGISDTRRVGRLGASIFFAARSHHDGRFLKRPGLVD